MMLVQSINQYIQDDRKENWMFIVSFSHVLWVLGLHCP